MNNQELQKTQSANSQIALQKPNHTGGSCHSVDILNGNYVLFSDGRIYSVRRDIFLKPNQDKPNWYIHFTLMRKKYYLHRLLAEYFIPNPLRKKYINHKNGDKADFRLDNLEWCTSSENVKHAFDNKLNYRPDSSGKKKISVSQFDISGNFIKKWESISDAANTLNTHVIAISRTIRGLNKTCKGFKWKYS